MNTPRPIVIIEDDLDDQEVLTDAFKDLGIDTELMFFVHPEDALHYLKTTPAQPFIIMSDVNLPGQNGVEFKRRIDADPQLRQKSIPFIFYSTVVQKQIVDITYKEMTVQGFFKKGDNYEDIKSDLRLIFDYWSLCKHPNS